MSVIVSFISMLNLLIDTSPYALRSQFTRTHDNVMLLSDLEVTLLITIFSGAGMQICCKRNEYIVEDLLFMIAA